jgi:hypothetical protein
MFRPDSLPTPLAAVLEQVRDWTDPVGPSPLPAHSPEERAGWVAGLQQLRDAVDASMLAAVAAFDAAGDGEVLHGAASTPSWLRGALGLAPGEAAERVRLARASRDLLDGPAERLREGSITYDHLRAIERAVRHVPTAQQDDAVALLADLAGSASVVDVRTAGRHLRLVADPDGTLAECEQQFDRRHLTLAPLLDGMTALDGLLDAESAALLTAALEPSLVPTGPEDLRTASQRRADGLLDIVRAAADHQLVPTVGGERPHLQLLVGAAPERLWGPGQLPQTPGGNGLLHPSGVARIACDAQIIPVLLDPDGVPMALGRTQRLFTPHQRRLLALRDGGCRFPGCTRPPAYTDAHHVVPWSEGGPTDTDNAILLCRFHHRLVHEGGWQISVTAHGVESDVTFTGPRNQQLTSLPRGP